MAYERTTGELFGRGGLVRSEVDGRIGLEVGWTVRGDRWGRGYGTEIGRAALAFAFDEFGAADVVAFTEPHNRRSRAVMEKLGMGFLREITGRGLVEGRAGVQDRAPFVLYAITRRAWAERRPAPTQRPGERGNEPRPAGRA